MNSEFVIENGRLVDYTGEGSEVVVPEGVLGISALAFNTGYNIRSISLPASLVDVDGEGFYACSSRETLTVHRDNPYFYTSGNCLIERDGGRLVLGCKGSQIPDDGSIRFIGRYAFNQCDGMEYITLPSSVIHIEEGAFETCEDLKEIEIPPEVRTIGDYAFASAEKMKYILIPPSVIRIGEDAFCACRRLIIFAQAGSCGARYAAEHNIKLKLL